MAEYALVGARGQSRSKARSLTALFEETARASGNARAAFNWVSGEVARKLNELGERFDRERVPAAALAGLIALVEKGTISASIAKTVFERCMTAAAWPTTSSPRTGWRRSATRTRSCRASARCIAANQDAVSQIRNGKTGTFGFLVGQVMKATGGKANPKLVNELLRRELQFSA